MPMTISCPSCHKSLRIGEENQGKKMRCPACQQVFKAPTLPDEPGDDPDERQEAEERVRRPEPRRDPDEDDRPSRRRRDEDEDERPSRRRDEDLDFSDRPSSRRRAAASDDDDDRPSRRRRDDEDEDDRPRRRRDDDDRPRRRRGGRGEAPNAVPFLIGGILVTLLCCLPGGVATVIFAAVGMSKASSGDYAGARSAINTAQTIMWISVGLGLLINILWVVVNVAGNAH
jgi:predicted Zn finger-like uncharacterized protein